MMRRILIVLASLALLAGCAWTLHAQSLPATKTLAWTPNPASDAVTSYTWVLDSNPVVTVDPVTCSLTECDSPITFTTTGLHTITVTASNVWGSASTSLTVTVSVPGKSGGLRIK